MGEEFSDFTTHLQWRLLLNLLAYSVRLPISLGHVVLPSALVMLDIFFILHEEVLSFSEHPV